jgi:hypothetical protein
MEKPLNANLKSMSISKQRLSEFIKLFKLKTNRKLTEQEALPHAETLLRTIAILYQPVSKKDYYSAIAKKMFLKNRKIIN